MDTILICEDSSASARMIKRAIEWRLKINTVCTYSFEETKKLLEKSNSFFAAILDYNLPDAPDGEVIDLVSSEGIPSIVFSGFTGDDIYDYLWSKKIVDYVIKEDVQSIDYICQIVARIMKNRHLKALIADDSRLIRKIVGNFLELHQFKVFEATNGEEALSIFEQHPDIALLITDYNMPKVDGFDLVREIRKLYHKDKLAIIGLSSAGQNISSKFIKLGANDFIHKPFKNEELTSRINNTLEMIDNINMVKKAAYTDFLTGMKNRKFFFENSQDFLNKCKKNSSKAAIGLIDIDHFKKFNDKYGHDSGDKVLIHVAKLIMEHFKEFGIVARIGGEEFVTLIEDSQEISLSVAFRKLKEIIETTPLKVGEKQLRVAVSIGVCSSNSLGTEELLKIADDKLYEAKSSGRNKVIIVEH